MRNVILCGDVIDKLKELPDKSVQCVVTSPPYYALRSYGTGKWVGGDPDCEHETVPARNGRGGSGPGSRNSPYPSEHPAKVCSKCGAVFEDKQIGLEESPELYVQKLVEVFREVWRVLRDDGIVFLNLGDSFAGSWGRSTSENALQKVDDGRQGDLGRAGNWQPSHNLKQYGLKPKDLIGIPWEVAFALRSDGWYLRRDIIWAKAVSFCPTYSGSCMPEPVTDRPTSSHEYIFILTKSGTPTYWVHRDLPHGTRKKPQPDYRYVDLLNGIEYTEKPEEFSKERIECPECCGTGKVNASYFEYEESCSLCDGTGKIKRWKRVNLWGGEDYFYDQEAVKEKTVIPEGSSHGNQAFGAPGGKAEFAYGAKVSGENWYSSGSRNLRSVWTINPQPYPKAHFATFSTQLVTPMIKLGTSEYGACPKCGAPWVRQVIKGKPNEEWKRACGADSHGEYTGKSEKWLKQDALGKQTYTGFNKRWTEKQQNASDVKRNVLNGLRDVKYTWKPSCDCGCDDRVPCIVLDIFGGSGTIGEAARNLGRDWILIDLNPEYVKLAEERLRLNESLDTFLKH